MLPRHHAALAVLVVLAFLPSRHADAQPSNDDCASARVIDTLPFTHRVDTTAATLDPADPNFDDCPLAFTGGQQPHSVWYRFTAPARMSIEINTFNSAVDTLIGAFTGACGGFTFKTCNEEDFDIFDQTSLSRMFVSLDAGETVYVSASTDAGGELTLNALEASSFQVNSYLGADFQRQPMVAAGPAGNSLVVWHDDRPGGGVFGRLYDSSGAPQGAEFQISTVANLSYPRVGAGGDGNFVVVWGESSGMLKGQRVSGAGALLGAAFVVSTDADYSDRHVAADAVGNFVVVWGEGLAPFGVRARLYDAAGVPQGADFEVAATASYAPEVGIDPAGRFVVVWTDGSGLDGSAYGVLARRFDGSGVPLGGAFVVNTVTAGNQGGNFLGPSVGVDAVGNFVVSWVDGYDSGIAPCDRECVKLRRFDATGAALSDEVVVSERTSSGYIEGLALASDSSGKFVVTWGDDVYGPFARAFDAGGTPQTPELLASEITADYMYHVGAAATGSGQFVVVWDHNPVNTEWNVYGRRIPPWPPLRCRAEPRTDCRQSTVDLKARLTLKDKAADAGDSFAWRWVRGEETALADLGDPTGTDGYSLCLYVDGGLLDDVPLASIPAGGTCTANPCWQDKGAQGFKYVDKSSSRGGLLKIVAKPGDAGEAKVVVKGKGTNLNLPTFPPALPLVVQLQAANGTCWSSEFRAEGVTKSEGGVFTARASVP